MILDETQAAIEGMLRARDIAEPDAKASKARIAMERAFEDALIADYDQYLPMCGGLPDPDDAHVLAAALKTQASMIVTENLKDFPQQLLHQMNLEVKSGDAFIADTIALGPTQAVEAIRRMRERFKKPEQSAEQLLLEMEARGLTETVDVLRPYTKFL